MIRRVSYRLSLALAVPLLVAVTGGAVIAYSHSRARHHIEVNTAERFRRVSAQAADAARDHLMQAVPVAELARGLMAEETALIDGPPEVTRAGHVAVARSFVAILRAHPELSWVSYGDEHGSFVGALYARDTPGLRTNLSVITGGKTVMDEHDVDERGQWTLRRHDDDFGYDPRTRPFYRAARERGGLIFTEPYVFFDQGVPGITCALPRYAGGELRGVLTVDFDLNRLSAFVAALQLSKRGQVFITTADQKVVAHPTTRLVESSGGGAEGRLVTLADVADPVVQAFAVHAAAGRRGFFALEVDGRPWYGSVTELPLEGGLTWLVGAAAPQSDFTAGLDRDLRTMLIVNLIVLALAIVGGVMLANGVSRPLEGLAADMAEIGQFRLDARPQRPSVFREIELMQEALARTRGGLRSFAAYVPRDLVRSVLASGREARLEGEVRELTVFFSDIAGFTTLAETRTPRELVELLGGYLDEVTTIVAANHGTVDKFLGDGVMAFWGAPADTPAHAALACEAAVHIQRRLAALPAGAGVLATRIGLASGEALVGNIGSHERMNYTVMGDIVNLAARLEGLNKQYGTAIMISETTRRAAGDRIVARPVDVVAVKGKHRAVRVYEVLALAADDAADVAAARRFADHCERGLELYLARDFAGAIAAYEAAVRDRGTDDGPATRFIARCRACLADPPPPDWDGVFHATEK